jgi:hypothetical protein
VVPAQGSWTPSINVPTLLTTVRLLMAQPNADDGLMPEVVSALVGRLFMHAKSLVLHTEAVHQ